MPASIVARSMEMFRGDTLFVLDRRIADDTRLETWVVMYQLDPTGCTWVPVLPPAR